MKIPPHITAEGIFYRGTCVVSLNGIAVNDVLMTNIDGTQYTLSATQFFPDENGLTVTLVEVNLPDIFPNPDALISSFGFNITLVRLTYSRDLNSITTLDYGAYIGIGLKAGFKKDKGLLRYELYWTSGLVVGAYFK